MSKTVTARLRATQMRDANGNTYDGVSYGAFFGEGDDAVCAPVKGTPHGIEKVKFYPNAKDGTPYQFEDGTPFMVSGSVSITYENTTFKNGADGIIITDITAASSWTEFQKRFAANVPAAPKPAPVPAKRPARKAAF